MGNVDMKLGNLSAARNAFQKELEISQKLAQADEENIGSVGTAYRRLGNVDLQLGKVAAARDAYQKALEISQQLVRADPQGIGELRDLSIWL